MKVHKKTIGMLWIILNGFIVFAQDLLITDQELSSVAERIYMNETGGKRENLIVWNAGENFLSLGIGHFIWYKKGEAEIYEEQFPALVKFIDENGVRLPLLLRKNEHAPWKTRTDFLRSKQKGELDTLEKFLYDTRDLQTVFIYKRLQATLSKMLVQAQDKYKVERTFNKMARMPGGLYVLIDYINFKGEGVNPAERYQGEGWGLLQVIDEMEPFVPHPDQAQETHIILTNFSHAAKSILKRRVKNSDPKRQEEQWLKGWFNRIDTYVP